MVGLMNWNVFAFKTISKWTANTRNVFMQSWQPHWPFYVVPECAIAITFTASAMNLQQHNSRPSDRGVPASYRQVSNMHSLCILHTFPRAQPSMWLEIKLFISLWWHSSVQFERKTRLNSRKAISLSRKAHRSLPADASPHFRHENA